MMNGKSFERTHESLKACMVKRILQEYAEKKDCHFRQPFFVMIVNAEPL